MLAYFSPDLSQIIYVFIYLYIIIYNNIYTNLYFYNIYFKFILTIYKLYIQIYIQLYIIMDDQIIFEIIRGLESKVCIESMYFNDELILLYICVKYIF